MAYFFTSDTHFNSATTLTREYRPFASTEECDSCIIDSFNRMAGKDDVIYHLGDFVNYSDKDTDSWYQSIKYPLKINAKIVLIIGNNEERIIKNHFSGSFDEFKNFAISSGFHDVKKEDYINLRDRNFYLNHYPSRHKDGYINLFGHTHRATGIWKPYGLNMSIDLASFRLITEDELFRMVFYKENFYDKDVDTNCM